MISIKPTQTDSWKKLESLSRKRINLPEEFERDAFRLKKMSLEFEDFYLDFSKNRITPEVFKNLVQLAEECGLDEAREQYFKGKPINETEGRAVLHTALRADQKSIPAIEEKVGAAAASKKKMYEFADSVISGKRKGATGKKFTHVVNIGIGGSDLGPVMVYEALAHYHNHLSVRFMSNVDGDHVMETLKSLDPETTLFVIVSKSFGTQETLTNALSVRKWFIDKLSREQVDKHFVAVSSNVKKAVDFGIEDKNIFPLFDWVGGRFSLWSTVGMSIALGVGTENFEQLLLGARSMDQHFKEQPAGENIPVILALLTIWYNNFLGAESEAIVPYSQYLHRLPAYLQQAIMESNGKGMDRDGRPVDYQTGNIVWGEPGTNAQHAFFQLLHQGTKLIPCTFIAFAKALNNTGDHQQKLLANYIAQSEALMMGKTEDAARAELEMAGKSKDAIDKLAPFKTFSGNRPTTSLLIEKLTPAALGKLVAMYEHKIFVEGVIWNIYSYDQWGVELGKQLADQVLKDMESPQQMQHDASTEALIKRVSR